MNQRHPDWITIYDKLPEAELPWHCEVLDPDLESALKKRGIRKGKILDLGCGNGVQAELLAQAGFNVVGIDISRSAIARAMARAAPNLRFQRVDIAGMAVIEGFDLAFDRGCFHVLAPAERAGFVRNVHRSMNVGGLLFLKCFSAEEPDRGFGPLRFSLEEIKNEFAGYFAVEDSIPTVFQGTKPHKPKSLFISMVRI